MSQVKMNQVRIDTQIMGTLIEPSLEKHTNKDKKHFFYCYQEHKTLTFFRLKNIKKRNS